MLLLLLGSAFTNLDDSLMNVNNRDNLYAIVRIVARAIPD